jgi:hypothetical protein
MRALAVLIMGLALVACADKAQVAGGSPKKSDTKPWEGVVAADGSNSSGDWKVGDQKSWEEHMRARAQGQNEYSRSASTASSQ